MEKELKIKSYQFIENKNQIDMIAIGENNQVYEFSNIDLVDISHSSSIPIDKNAITISLNFNKIFYEK